MCVYSLEINLIIYIFLKREKYKCLFRHAFFYNMGQLCTSFP